MARRRPGGMREGRMVVVVSVCVVGWWWCFYCGIGMVLLSVAGLNGELYPELERPSLLRMVWSGIKEGVDS